MIDNGTVVKSTIKNINMQPRSFTIAGEPLPLMRARYNRVSVYDPQKTAKLVIGITISNQNNNKPPILGPVILDITFFMPIPKSKKKKIKPGDPHIIKPDISNLIKLYEDVSSGIIFKDDCQITQILARKIYDINPRTEFKVIPL